MTAAYEPTEKDRSMVEAMAGYGIPQDDIAKVLKIDPKTLRKHYAPELETGSIVATVKVAQNLFTIANGKGREAVTAAIFWLKCRAGWSEYSPKPPAAPREISLGKKELADNAADEATNDAPDWGTLVH